MRASTTRVTARQPPAVIVWLPTLVTGGAELQTLGVAADLQKAGHRVHVIAHEHCGPKARRVQALLDRHKLEWTILPPAEYGRGYRYFPSLVPTARFLRQFPRSTILAALSGPNVSAGLLRRFLRGNRVVWNQRDEGLWRLFRYQERLAISSCTSITAVSEGAKAHLVRDLGVRPERVQVIRNAARMDAPIMSREEWRISLEVSATTPLFVKLANLTFRKDHETLLRAWALFKADAGSELPDALLLLAGEHGDRAHRARALIAELGVGESVRLLGAVRDVSGLLAAADVGVLSSESEGSPGALLEYFHSNLPVIATDIRGVNELDPGRRAVRYAAVGDPADLARQLRMLATDRMERRRLAAEGRSISSRHSPELQTRQYLELL